jgi:hypothetical protein
MCGSSADDSSADAAQHTLPSLQHLELHCVRLKDAKSLLQFTNAPQLSRLVFTDLTFTKLSCTTAGGFLHGSEAGIQQLAVVTPALLQQVPLL